jgi:hypothetical protein
MRFCTIPGSLCKCTIVEKLTSTGSCHGEILGAILAQIILHTAIQGQMGPYPIIMEDCSNLGIVRHGNKPQWSLSTIQPQADVLKILKQYIASQPFALKFLFVALHANNTKSWKDCSLKERINIKVNILAKKALICTHAEDQYFNGRFPLEDFQIYTNGIKVMGQVKPTLKEYWGRTTAKIFLDHKNIVPLEEFDTIWWTDVRK